MNHKDEIQHFLKTMTDEEIDIKIQSLKDEIFFLTKAFEYPIENEFKVYIIIVNGKPITFEVDSKGRSTGGMQHCSILNAPRYTMLKAKTIVRKIKPINKNQPFKVFFRHYRIQLKNQILKLKTFLAILEGLNR